MVVKETQYDFIQPHRKPFDNICKKGILNTVRRQFLYPLVNNPSRNVSTRESNPQLLMAMRSKDMRVRKQECVRSWALWTGNMR